MDTCKGGGPMRYKIIIFPEDESEIQAVIGFMNKHPRIKKEK